MPRLKNPIPGIPLKIYIPQDILSEIYLRLYDKETEEIPYGAITGLFVSLARAWIRE